MDKKVARDTEGAKALAEYSAQSIAMRKNMERLRALRLAKEAAEPPPVPAKKAAKPKAKAKKAAVAVAKVEA